MPGTESRPKEPKPLVQGGSFAKDSVKAAVIDGQSVGGCLKATCRSARALQLRRLFNRQVSCRTLVDTQHLDPRVRIGRAALPYPGE